MKVTSINSKKIILSSLNSEKNEVTRDVTLKWGDKIFDIKDAIINYEVDHSFDLMGDASDSLRHHFQTINLQMRTSPNIAFLIGNTTS